RTATMSVRAPQSVTAKSLSEIRAAGMTWWPLQMARELDDAVLSLRTNELELGLWILKTSGNADAVLEIDRQLAEHRSNWFVREVINMLRRMFARLDVASRSMYAIIEEGSCFAGTLFELALAADRSYMLNNPANPEATFIALSEMNLNLSRNVEAQSATADVSTCMQLSSINGLPRILSRFYGDEK